MAAPSLPAAPDVPGWRHVYSGKVRDLYEPVEPHPLGDVLLVVASDRISAYDWVLPTPIPGKGEVLTALSLWWFDRVRDLVPNHTVEADVPEEVAGRGMVVRKPRDVPRRVHRPRVPHRFRPGGVWREGLGVRRAAS